MQLSRREITNALRLTWRLETLGFDCARLRKQLEYRGLIEGIRHAVDCGDANLLTSYYHQIRQADGLKAAYAFLAYLIKHASLTYCPERGIITTKKGIPRQAAEHLPEWRAWASGREADVSQLVRPFIRRCGQCGSMLNSVRTPGIFGSHHCEPPFSGSAIPDADEPSSSVRAFSGGGGPGTGKRR